MLQLCLIRSFVECNCFVEMSLHSKIRKKLENKKWGKFLIKFKFIQILSFIAFIEKSIRRDGMLISKLLFNFLGK